jgi:4-hydroxy 2-oxovalerate aldolase
VDDQSAIDTLSKRMINRSIVTILPGKSSVEYQEKIKEYIKNSDSITIGVNTILPEYTYDYLLFTSEKKYEYAKENNGVAFNKAIKILTSNIKAEVDENEIILNYNDLQKYGWKYYDNSMLMLLRLLKRVDPSCIAIAGFDGYKGEYTKEYAPTAIKGNLSQVETAQLQADIESMLEDYVSSFDHKFDVKFLTPSPFEKFFC